MKYSNLLLVLLLSALLLCTMLSVTALAEDEITLNAEDMEIVLEDAPETDAPELSLDDVFEIDNTALVLGGDTLDLNAELVMDGEVSEASAASPAFDGEEIPIDEAHFPDANFRNYVANWCDSSCDGVLSAQERADVINLWLDGLEIVDLRGMEYFPALTELDCCGNRLTSLDVSQNTTLKWLTCNKNQLTSLDVSGCTSLTKLECDYNQLTSLDVSGCTALAQLWCFENPLKSLNASGCISLEQLDMPSQYDYSGKVTSLDVSGCTALTQLDCDGNLLKSLNVSGCTALTHLDCGYNGLTSLDVSECTALTDLVCSYNPLTRLDVSRCTALTDLECEYNKLTSLDVSQNTALTYLNCIGNQLTSLDVSACTALTELDCSENKLTSLDVSHNTALTGLGCSGNKLTSLDVSHNTALTGLDCEANALTSLDVSHNTALTALGCGENKLTGLDVSHNTALTWLDCEANALTSLDVSHNTALTKLECGENKLTGLDVSHNTALTRLQCDSNRLTGLDVNKNEKLVILNCEHNRLTSLDLSGCKFLSWAVKEGERVDNAGCVFFSVSYEVYQASISFDASITVTAKSKTLYEPKIDKISIKKCKVTGIKSQTYTGKAITHKLVVKYGKTTLKKGVDYAVSYSNNKAIGTATVTVTGKGNYTGSVKKTFKINPKPVKLSSLDAGKQLLTVKWKKGAGGVSYELQYSRKKSFSKAVTMVVKNTGTVKQVIKDLASGKIYYVRIRAFKKVGGKGYVSAWSKALSKKVE